MEILSLGEKIKRIRKERNMTLRDLAGDKVTPGQISLVESGKSKPSLDLLEYIAEKMDVSIDYIIETEEHQAEKLCDYYFKVGYGSVLAQNYSQAKEAISKGLAYADNYDLQYYKGLSELYTGMIDYGQDNYENAQERFLASSEIFLKTGEFRDAIEAYIYLGLTAYKLIYYNVALNYFKQAEKLAAEYDIQDDELQQKIFFNISLCYSMLDNNQSSVDYALLAMEKYNIKNDRFHYGQTLLMLSLSYNSMNKQKESLIYADKAINIFKQLDEMSFVAKMETNIGEIYSGLGSMDESFKHLENACTIKRELGDKTLPYTMLRMVDNYIKINNIEKAVSIVRDIYDNFCDDEHDDYRVAVFYYLYKLYLAKEDYKKAELNILEAIKYLKNLDMPKQLADAYIILGDFYKSMENDFESLECYSKGLSIYKEIGIVPQQNLY